jgi:hypothetical protein
LTFYIEEWQEGCLKSALPSANDIEGLSFNIEGKTYDIVPDIVPDIVTQYRRIARRRPNIEIQYQRFSFDIEGENLDIVTVPNIVPNIAPEFFIIVYIYPF